MTTTTHFFDDFQPTHYQLTFDIDREAKRISGETRIQGHASAATIRLHQHDLSVQAVTADGAAVPFTVDNAQDALTVTLPATGDVALTVTYSAPLTDTMMGIYPSYYVMNGVKKQIIGTQFETNAARQAFPGIDEPAAKATFDVAIRFDEKPGETILANMPEVVNENGLHRFATTLKMSTYLIAFAFGELQTVQAKTASGVQVGVYATKAHQACELDFALDIATRAIEFFEDYYQTPYPLPHSWQLALPDFSAGAMENWGLVTYREAALLVDPANTTLAVKRYVASVIAHELAHQWFGDLVTMQWWDDLWLNESFANMMEYVAVDALEPDWHIWESYQTGEVPMALRRDATDGVQAVHVEVEDPAEIDALFDPAIVYAKGGRMLVMVRNMIGEDAMRAGLKAYFAAHQYGNATGGDLWAALGEAAGQDLGAVMQAWLTQPGYPVVTAAVENGHLVLTQQQFFIGAGKDVGRTWPIPLNANYKIVPELMTDTTLDLGDYVTLRAEAGEPFRLNVGNEAHFIVNYDARLLADLMGEAAGLDAIAQLQLLQDLTLLADGRQVGYASLVPLLAQFVGSRSAIVLAAVSTIIGRLRQFVTTASPAEANLKALVNALTADQMSRLGWVARDGEALDDTLARPIIAQLALFGNNPTATVAAHELFEAHADRLAELPAAVRGAVLQNEVEHFGNAALFETLLDAYRTTADPSFRTNIAGALTQTRDAQQVAALVVAFEDAETIKPQDLRGWFFNLLANPAGEQAAWDWLRSDWGWLEQTVGGDMAFTSYITVVSRVFKTPQRLAEFKAFFEPKLTVPGLGREITMDIRVIETRVALIEAEQTAVNSAVERALAS